MRKFLDLKKIISWVRSLKTSMTGNIFDWFEELVCFEHLCCHILY